MLLLLAVDASLALRLPARHASPNQMLRLPESVARALSPSMAGFGVAAANKKKSGKKEVAKPVAKLSMRRQWDRFNELVGSGAPRTPVYARASGDKEWTAVGYVASAEGIGAASAVQLHKRFILEHAVRVSPKLQLKVKTLECGYATGVDEEKSLLEKGTTPADAPDAGFEGLPDPSARYAALNNIDNVKKMDQSASKMPMGGY